MAIDPPDEPHDEPHDERPGVPPRDDPPWAMQLVVRVERAGPPGHRAVCEAAAMAVARLLADARSGGGGPWRAAVDRWESGRIRKVVRRARGTRWEAAQGLPGVTVDHDGAQVRAFVPGPVADMPPELARLQVAGLDLPDDEPKPPPDPPYALIALNPSVRMTTGKAAAQCGHAVQLLLWRAGAWKGLRVRVVRPEPRARAGEWSRRLRRGRDGAEREAAIVVRDAGFTEVDPGTVTAMAWLVPS